MHSENDKEGSGPQQTFTGRDVLYREGAVALLDVQRAADALLRQGRKPSVAAIREHLGGGSPNTITPLLAKYWEKLGSRLGDGPESLERVPEALARVTELLWRRALEEARERLKILQQPDHKPGALEELQRQIGKLSVALAEAGAREGEHLAQLSRLFQEREAQQYERRTLTSMLQSAQALAKVHITRVASSKPSHKPKRRTSRGSLDSSGPTHAPRSKKKVNRLGRKAKSIKRKR
jgi:hypothetical protein